MSDKLTEEEVLARLREAALSMDRSCFVMPKCTWCDTEAELLIDDLCVCEEHLTRIELTHPEAVARVRRYLREDRGGQA